MFFYHVVLCAGDSAEAVLKSIPTGIGPVTKAIMLSLGNLSPIVNEGLGKIFPPRWLLPNFQVLMSNKMLKLSQNFLKIKFSQKVLSQKCL